MDENYEIGTTINGRLLGEKSDTTHLFVWINCPNCGKERWVQLNTLTKQKIQGQCHKCMLVGKEFGGNWKGGKIKGGGRHSPYIMVWVKATDFYYPMVTSHPQKDKITGGYVSEHRLVLAKHLGRNLHSWEIVHHRNGIKTDNRIENLQLISDMGHKQMTLMLQKIDSLEKEIYKLRQIIPIA